MVCEEVLRGRGFAHDFDGRVARAEFVEEFDGAGDDLGVIGVVG